MIIKCIYYTISKKRIDLQAYRDERSPEEVAHKAYEASLGVGINGVVYKKKYSNMKIYGYRSKAKEIKSIRDFIKLTFPFRFKTE